MTETNDHQIGGGSTQSGYSVVNGSMLVIIMVYYYMDELVDFASRRASGVSEIAGSAEKAT
ncbi:hypothetical protein HYFRA_00002719 [Hymenoscyphus fraxineus]|uniref:Uncharacterized protein n=1 Tax=Hymenoscyphus fraxineus TaxID=746836 RepID=A0A9N9PQA8_9HELO|nr:hypothetical protein HYFRA_00005679 [Hymenoscyphus fraxineus]CAG8961176.1 hypothetical protein HYFRA_00002719 [Hymenoscyphus fraxineus]